MKLVSFRLDGAVRVAAVVNGQVVHLNALLEPNQQISDDICDVCQDVCPWNHKFARPQAVPLVQIEPSRTWVPFDAFGALDESGFERAVWMDTAGASRTAGDAA